jgi:DHA1 family tetracycline resistance protein-like MFS transporter
MSGGAPANPIETAAPRGAAVIFIFVTILLDTLALGVIIPILPKLIESFVDNDTANAARIFGLFGTAWALMQFFFSPILGALSDRFGRRPVVLLSNFGLSLDYVLMALAPSLSWLFVGRVISGITSASISTAFAYIADITAAEKRAEVFGKIGVAFGAGFILGPALGGLLGDIDPRLPFWVAAGLSFANALYGWLILPESLPPERRSPLRWRAANPVGALHLLRSDRVLTGLSIANFFAQLAHVVLPSVFVLYATYRYGWSTTMVGATLAVVGICSMIVQGGAIGPIVRKFGERRALLLGFGCGAIGFLIFGAAPTGFLSWLGIPFMALWGVAGAATQALMTRLVVPEQQGQLQGATTSVQSVSQLLGPFLFTLTFAHFIGAQAPFKLPGAPFYLASALLLLALAVSVRTLALARAR